MNDRKMTLSLENLETRNLQSGVSAATASVCVSHTTPAPPSAVIAPASGHIHAAAQIHDYHGTTAFFGQ
jgi:hypothetical protein